jgi:thymidine kinase
MLGQIKLYIGPMFSGKTSKLISKYTGPNDCVVIKPAKDTRCQSTEIRSHDGIAIPAIAIDRLYYDRPYLPPTTRRILIDEGQFFNELSMGCMFFISLGIDVYVAALNGTSERKPWGAVTYLIPHADKIKHMTAVRCSMCMKKRAPFTALKEGLVKDEEVMIGGAESYIPVCRTCTQMRMMTRLHRFKNGVLTDD